MTFRYGWRDAFTNAELASLHADGFGSAPVERDWWALVNRHSLGWVCARRAEGLVGFVNVAWDGGAHAFLLDTVVATGCRRHGIGAELVAVAVRQARAAGCHWLHVDFEDRLAEFYLGRCGFRPTAAGVIALRAA
jgi:GNAT superfamily N-acetyltransferase